MKKSLLCILISLLGACSLLGWQKYQRYDDRSISILTVNLFDQRLSPDSLPRSWRGDWLFRRERLELIDQSLRMSRPDLLLFQDMLAKKGSLSDSDRSILAQGALQGSEWHSTVARFYDDTQEASHQSIAVNLPIRIDRSFRGNSVPLGRSGFVNFVLLELDGEPILTANVQMPIDSVQVDSWYKVLLDLITLQLEEISSCSERLVIGGYLPGHTSWPAYQEFMTKLELKDSSVGFCELASECLTADTSNEMYMLTSDDDAGGRVDRIFVHRSSIVLSSQRSMLDTIEGTRYAKMYQLTKLWPTRRFAWMTTLRLAKCRKLPSIIP